MTSTRRKTIGSFQTPTELSKQIMKIELESFKREVTIDDHLVTLYELQRRYHTNLDTGLTPEEAEEVLLRDGPNCLMSTTSKSKLLIFATYMFGGFSALLWLGALLSLAGFTVTYVDKNIIDQDQLYLVGVLVVVVLVTGLFGYYQEYSNVSIMEGFTKLLPKFAKVIRDGEYFEIPSEEVVVGDLVEVNRGDCIPADLRLIDTNGLKIDNSSITGECEPQLRLAETTDKDPLETANLAFFGTYVVEGSGLGIVIATGPHTLMGHIAGLTTNLVAEETTIKRELSHFIHVITGLAIFIGGTFLVTSITIGYDFFEAFVFFIAITLANVPEGLLVTMTACLTLTAKRMARKKCLVKNLQAIETLGSTSVICSDKTGTLTQNRMTVSHMYYDGKVVDVLTSEYEPAPDPSFSKLCRVAILCSNAIYNPKDMSLPPEQRSVMGDASESAVFKCMEKLIGDVIEKRLENPKVCEIPFNSKNKFQLSIHRRNNGRFILVMKGAPERIIDNCETIAWENDSPPIENYKNSINKAMLDMGYMGERVLGFADLELSEDEYPPTYVFDIEEGNFPLTGFRFVGLMSMIDPPKVGVLTAINKCKTAGIQVVMVTGDHPITAVAIAKKVGIISPENNTVYDIAMRKNVAVAEITSAEKLTCEAMVVTGSELRMMSDMTLDNMIETYEEIVFSRTSPQQKLQIVEAFQRIKKVVAVTGDGVNDSPALKKADIGVAMGISGSDVSKEAADMILLDDNFATIVNGIEEGRLIFDNLKKSISYVLTSNLPELMPFMLLVLLDIPPSLSVIAIIIIDVGTDLWPGVSLAYEPPEADIMLRPPRNLDTDKLVNVKLILFTYLQIGVIQACAGFTSYFYAMARHGFLLDRVLGLRKEWICVHCNDVLDSYGQEWTFEERMFLQRKCGSAFFLAIVVTQLADLIICKNRRLSIIEQKMKNWVLNMGMIGEIAIALFVVYCPYVNRALQFEPIEFICVMPAVPYALFILVYDETRRYVIRNYPGGWFERETYF